MTSSQKQNVIVEIAETGDSLAGKASNVTDILKAISASEAFRKYNWLTSAPVLNTGGDLRGMVVSARWRTVFQVSGKVGGVLGNIAVVAGLAANIAHSWNEIEGIVNSNEPWDVKGAKLSTQVTSVATRTLLGAVPAGFSVLAFSMQGYCELGGLASGGRFRPQACIADLRSANATVNTTFSKVTDGNNIYSFLNVNITPRVSKWMGYSN